MIEEKMEMEKMQENEGMNKIAGISALGLLARSAIDHPSVFQDNQQEDSHRKKIPKRNLSFRTMMKEVRDPEMNRIIKRVYFPGITENHDSSVFCSVSNNARPISMEVTFKILEGKLKQMTRRLKKTIKRSK